jgi:hypothetical protein
MLRTSHARRDPIVTIAIIGALCLGGSSTPTRAASPLATSDTASVHHHADGSVHRHAPETRHRSADFTALSALQESALAARNLPKHSAAADGPAHLLGRWSEVYTTPVVAMDAC